MSSKFSNASPIIQAKQPVVDCTPRFENKCYEFTSFSALAHCLENGTFVFTVDVSDDKYDQDQRIFTSVKGKFGDEAFGRVKIALAEQKLLIKTIAGKKQMVYSFLKSNSPGYIEQKKIRDTKEDYKTIIDHLTPHFVAICEKYYPDFSYSYHSPDEIRFAFPKKEETIEASAEGEKVIDSKEFKPSDLLKRNGRMMVNISSLWFLETKSVMNKLLGVKFNLCRDKYFTADEKAEFQANKKRARDEADTSASETEISKVSK